MKRPAVKFVPRVGRNCWGDFLIAKMGSLVSQELTSVLTAYLEQLVHGQEVTSLATSIPDAILLMIGFESPCSC